MKYLKWTNSYKHKVEWCLPGTEGERIWDVVVCGYKVSVTHVKVLEICYTTCAHGVQYTQTFVKGSDLILCVFSL